MVLSPSFYNVFIIFSFVNDLDELERLPILLKTFERSLQREVDLGEHHSHAPCEPFRPINCRLEIWRPIPASC